MLHPEGRVSDVQRRQMTTVLAPNVHNIAIDGSFDDAQAMVKRLFGDKEARAQVDLSAVNSINWARLMAQVVYYFYAAVRLGGPDRPVAFSVPTGNFGDVFAGYVAAQMGLPIARLVVATNVNDILHRALTRGDYSAGTVTPAATPSMDIQVSSNFERLLFDLGARRRPDHAMMGEFDRSRAMTIRRHVAGARGCFERRIDGDAWRSRCAGRRSAAGDHRPAQRRWPGGSACAGHRCRHPGRHACHRASAKFREASRAGDGRSSGNAARLGNLFERETLALPGDYDAVKAFVLAGGAC